MAADTVCRLTQEGEHAIHELLASNEILQGVSLKCSLRTKEVTVEHVLHNTHPEQLVEDAELAGEQRIVIYKCGWKVPSDPDGKTVPSQIIVWFNPAETSDIKLQRCYGPTAEDLCQRVLKGHFKRTYQINNAEDFTSKWLESQNYATKLHLA